MSLRDVIDPLMPFLTDFRRDLHAHPELMYEEHRTASKVKEQLEKSGMRFHEGLAGGTGLMAYLPATELGGSTVALRADMDALPILEETGLEYKSKTDGVMHACGHDGHTSILVGALHTLNSLEHRPNNVIFVFQPAEEGGAGGKRMCDDGVIDGSLEGTRADVIYGLHGWPGQPKGEFYVRNGAMLAATDEFELVIRGKGGHAATPHLTHDPIVASSAIVNSLQSVASRTVDPLESIVVTVGSIQGGHAHNVIPDSVRMKGTMRTLSDETRVLGERRIKEIVSSVAQAHGCTAEIKWHIGYPVTFNDSWATDRFRQVAQDIFGSERLNELPVPIMGGEDFSFYGEHVPACFYFVGLTEDGVENPPLLHTPKFDFNDDVIGDCVEMMCELALAEVLSGD